MTYQLRWWQEKAIQGCREAIRQGYKRIILYLPTGAGKTIAGIDIIKFSQIKGKRVGFGVNRVQLSNQARMAFLHHELDHGILQGKNSHSTDKPVLIFSIDSVRTQGLPELDFLLLDEAHRTCNREAYWKIMKDRIIIGLTATPFKKGMGRHIPELGGPLWETIVAGATMQELIEWNREHPLEGLVPGEVWIPSEIDTKGMRTSTTDGEQDWNIEDQATALNQPKLVGDVVEKWLQIAPGTQTMVFATNIDHSKELCSKFRLAGINAEHVDYHMDPDKEREQIYAKFRRNEITVLCNCILLGEGADFPACETIVLARLFKSKVVITQIVGRAMRPAQDKTGFKVIDHGGSLAKLGLPWHYSVLNLDDGKPPAKSLKQDGEICEKCGYKKKKKGECPRCNPKETICPECRYLIPVGKTKCPKCGNFIVSTSEIEHVDGELKQFTGHKKVTVPTKDRLLEMGPQTIYSQLCYISIKRGYSKGWRGYKFASIFGKWPTRLQEEPMEPDAHLLAWIRHANIRWALSKKRGF